MEMGKSSRRVEMQALERDCQFVRWNCLGPHPHLYPVNKCLALRLINNNDNSPKSLHQSPTSIHLIPGNSSWSLSSGHRLRDSLRRRFRFHPFPSIIPHHPSHGQLNWSPPCRRAVNQRIQVMISVAPINGSVGWNLKASPNSLFVGQLRS